MEKNDLLSKIVSLCKRRGFVYQGSEMYGGLAGTWDLGPYGSELAHNIKELWWNHFVREQENMFSITTSALMPEAVWKASGHLKGFFDPIVECTQCRKRFRADQLQETGEKTLSWKCPECKTRNGVFQPRQFNLMFK